MTVLPRPIQQPHPPLWVAMTQPDTCAIAGDHGIGLLCPAIAPPETFTAHIEAYKKAVAQPTRVAGAFVNDQIGMFTVTLCADDDDRARHLGGPAGLWYISTVAEIYRNDWRGVPLDEVPDSYRYHVEMKRERGTANTALGVSLKGQDPQAMGQSFIDSGAFCIGGPDQVIASVERYRAAGADRLVSVMQLADLRHEDLMRSIELMGTKVIPAIRARESATQ